MGGEGRGGKQTLHLKYISALSFLTGHTMQRDVSNPTILIREKSDDFDSFLHALSKAPFYSILFYFGLLCSILLFCSILHGLAGLHS